MTRLNKPLARISNGQLDGTFGRDRNRRVVITLRPATGTYLPDMIELRPERTRRSELIAVMDVYRYALKCRVNRELLERARNRKARKAERLARARQDRAEKRLIRPL